MEIRRISETVYLRNLLTCAKSFKELLLNCDISPSQVLTSFTLGIMRFYFAFSRNSELAISSKPRLKPCLNSRAQKCIKSINLLSKVYLHFFLLFHVIGPKSLAQVFRIPVGTSTSITHWGDRYVAHNQGARIRVIVKSKIGVGFEVLRTVLDQRYSVMEQTVAKITQFAIWNLVQQFQWFRREHSDILRRFRVSWWYVSVHPISQFARASDQSLLRV